MRDRFSSVIDDKGNAHNEPGCHHARKCKEWITPIFAPDQIAPECHRKEQDGTGSGTGTELTY